MHSQCQGLCPGLGQLSDQLDQLAVIVYRIGIVDINIGLLGRICAN